MANYYYLMAQLPGIVSGSPLPITYDAFRETAERTLSRKDSEILAKISLEPPRVPEMTGSDFVDRWFLRERALRLSLERVRAAKLKREINASGLEDALINEAAETAQIARTAASFEDPLEAERYLDRTREAFVAEILGTHSFDSEAVFAYALMVLLHERESRFNAEAGSASYTTIYNQILGE